MKILLIYPPAWIRYNLLPPIGMAILAGKLKEAGFEVTQRNMELDILSDNLTSSSIMPLSWITKWQDIRRYIFENNSSDGIKNFLNYLKFYEDWGQYDVICLSTIGELQVGSSAVIATYIKKIFPSVKIFIGGSYCYTLPSRCKNLLSRIGCTAIDLIYPYDDGGHRLVKYLISKQFLGGEQNPFLIGTSLQYKNTDFSSVSDLLKYSIPKFVFDIQQQKILAKHLYGLSPDWPMLQYLVSIGCIANCSFCTRGKRKPTFKPPDVISRELLELANTYGTPFFKLECDLINPSLRWANLFGQELIKNKVPILWNAYARVMPMDRETAYTLRKSGCVMLRFGVETGSDKVLKQLRKGYTVKDTENTLRVTKEQGIWNGVLFMVGTPGETRQDVEQTILFIRKNKRYIDSAIVNIFSLLSGTPFYEIPQDFNLHIYKDCKTQEICFDDLNTGKTWENYKHSAIETHERIVQTLIDEGIGLTGTSVDLVHLALLNFGNHIKARDWLCKTHSHFLEPLPHHMQRWRLYHPTEPLPYNGYESPIFSERLGYSGIEVIDTCFQRIRESNYETVTA